MPISPCTKLATSMAVSRVRLKAWKKMRRSSLGQPLSDA